MDRPTPPLWTSKHPAHESARPDPLVTPSPELSPASEGSTGSGINVSRAAGTVAQERRKDAARLTASPYPALRCGGAVN